MRPSFKRTMYACFVGYIVQAIVNNFVPLLFVTFQKSYQIPLSKITLLITINFMIQLLIDLLSAGFVDRIGYKASVTIAHICSAVGDRSVFADDPSGSHGRSVYRHSDRSCDLRNRRRTSGGTDQPDHRGLPDRQQRKSNEPSAFVLLLGTCRSSTDFNYFLQYDGN